MTSDNPLGAVDRHHDVDLGADQDEEVVGDVALPEEELPLVDLASNPQLCDQRHVGCVQRWGGFCFIWHAGHSVSVQPGRDRSFRQPLVTACNLASDRRRRQAALTARTTPSNPARPDPNTTSTVACSVWCAQRRASSTDPPVIIATLLLSVCQHDGGFRSHDSEHEALLHVQAN